MQANIQYITWLQISFTAKIMKQYQSLDSPQRWKLRLERAGDRKEGVDLIQVLGPAAALDAGGHIDRGGAGNAHRLGQQLSGQPPRQHPRAAPGPPGDQSPVEGETVTARQSVRPARRLRIEQQQVRDLLVPSGGEHV